MINVIASIEVNENSMDEFLKIFNANVPNVLAEDGCIAYSPTLDVETGIPVQVLKTNTATIIEAWESIEHLHAHLKSPHMLEYRTKVKDIVKSVSIQVTQPA